MKENAIRGASATAAVRNAGLGSWPERRLRISPDRDAIWFEGTTTSHAGFAERVRRTAAALAGLGVAAGDRVAWTGGNHPSALETLYACGQLGAIWVPVNARLAAPEAEYVLRHSGASVVVHGREHGELGRRAAGPAGRRPGTGWPPSRRRTAAPTRCPTRSCSPSADPQLRDEPVALEDPCLIMYTSGTTGRPKGAVLTHGNMTWNAMNQLLGLRLRPGRAHPRAGAAVPHRRAQRHGQPDAAARRVRGGRAPVRPAPRPSPSSRSSGSTRSSPSPPCSTRWPAQPGFATRDLSALRTIGAAGAPLPLPTLRTWLDRGVTMQQAYGMTEAAPGCTVLDSADAERKVGSAGKPVFFTDVRVVRPDGTRGRRRRGRRDRRPGPERHGRLLERPGADRRGVLATAGTTPATPARVDDEGFLYIRDRYKDMIISGGENIYPAEVESALLELAEVLEAAVIGVPDQKWGEVGLAVVVPAPRRRPGPRGRAAPAARAARRASRCPGTWSSPTSCPRPPPARSASPTCATTTSRPRRPPHDHDHDHRRTALAQGPGARHQRLGRGHPGAG